MKLTEEYLEETIDSINTTLAMNGTNQQIELYVDSSGYRIDYQGGKSKLSQYGLTALETNAFLEGITAGLDLVGVN